jgi:hypothetical protein
MEPGLYFKVSGAGVTVAFQGTSALDGDDYVDWPSIPRFWEVLSSDDQTKIGVRHLDALDHLAKTKVVAFTPNLNSLRECFSELKSKTHYIYVDPEEVIENRRKRALFSKAQGDDNHISSVTSVYATFEEMGIPRVDELTYLRYTSRKTFRLSYNYVYREDMIANFPPISVGDVKMRKANTSAMAAVIKTLIKAVKPRSGLSVGGTLISHELGAYPFAVFVVVDAARRALDKSRRILSWAKQHDKGVENVKDRWIQGDPRVTFVQSTIMDWLEKSRHVIDFAEFVNVGNYITTSRKAIMHFATHLNRIASSRFLCIITGMSLLQVTGSVLEPVVTSVTSSFPKYINHSLIGGKSNVEFAFMYMALKEALEPNFNVVDFSLNWTSDLHVNSLYKGLIVWRGFPMGQVRERLLYAVLDSKNLRSDREAATPEDE